MCWERLSRGACGWVATAPKAQRITITTTTTTTVFEPEGEPEDVEPENENFLRQARRDDPRVNPRWAVWRREAIRNFGRLGRNLWKWHELLGFAGSVLATAKGRYRLGRIAIGEEAVTGPQYARAVSETRWQSAPSLRSGRRS